jgi:hypothetical protein
MSGRPVKTYDLYPCGRGFSAKTADYQGEIIQVVAVSIRQAYYLAGKTIWADGPDRPVGVVEHYTKNGPEEGWHRLWCGCRIHGGIRLQHGAGKRAIATAMRAHLARAHTEEAGR